MLSGLSADSPLGRIVQIRAENDPKMLKHFTAQQRKIRSDWRSRTVKNISTKGLDEMLGYLKNMFVSMSGGVKNG